MEGGRLKRYLLLLVVSTLPTLCMSCHSPTGPAIKQNPYLKEIRYIDYPKKNGFFFCMGVWRGNSIYAVKQFSQFVIDDSCNVVHDTVLSEAGIYDKVWTYIDANASGSKILLVDSRYGDVSMGDLEEYVVQTGQWRILFDQSHNISSARYFPGDDNKIVYYTYGDNNFNGAGYYLYDEVSGTDSLLFPYLSSAGPTEMLNGFDIHPNGDTLLIPVCESTPYVEKPVRLGIISLRDRKLDTLDLDFGYKIGLWVRYNHDASRILYCCFPYGTLLGETVSNISELGIIELPSMSKSMLGVDTYLPLHSLQIAPTWSPDEKAIVFGSAPIAGDGDVGMWHLYVLTRLN